MIGEPHSIVRMKHKTDSPSAATAAVNTIPADAAEIHVIRAVYWSYDAAPTGGKLTITIGGSTKHEFTIASKGPDAVYFDQNQTRSDVAGLHGDYNEEVVVTLASGAGAVVGKVNTLYA